ncbi:MAG: hydantoinase/oxoprolinase family protein [Gemmobacter sp.]
MRRVWPNPHVSASAQILPEIREFERFSTTALNAYLQPEVSGYLHRLDGALRGQGFGGEFLIVQSNGGVMTVGESGCGIGSAGGRSASDFGSGTRLPQTSHRVVMTGCLLTAVAWVAGVELQRWGPSAASAG